MHPVYIYVYVYVYRPRKQVTRGTETPDSSHDEM